MLLNWGGSHKIAPMNMCTSYKKQKHDACVEMLSENKMCIEYRNSNGDGDGVGGRGHGICASVRACLACVCVCLFVANFELLCECIAHLLGTMCVLKLLLGIE